MMRSTVVFLVMVTFLFAGMSEGGTVKKVVRETSREQNLLKPNAWGPWQRGFEVEGNTFVCDNGSDTNVQRGASQTVVLNQGRAQPIVATAWSKAEGVTGGSNSDYSLYLDLTFTDGGHLYGQKSPFSVGTHDWEKRQVTVFPDRPVRSVSLHLLLRRHGGKAWFRGASLQQIAAPKGSVLFDGVPVILEGALEEGLQVRDVAANSDFVDSEGADGLGLRVRSSSKMRDGARFFEVEVEDTTGKDRAITLVYSVPVGRGWTWLANARTSVETRAGREYVETSHFQDVGATGKISRYPFGAVAMERKGLALAMDIGKPAFYRVGYNAGSGELFLACDIGLVPEKNSARVGFCKYEFDAEWKFRGALAKLYDVFPEYFRCRTPKQGLWMPFAKISSVEGWEDFGFKFKEGNNEVPWDDEHGMVTFRYTEPMTWWMKMPKSMPRTIEAASREMKRLADTGDKRAKAAFVSGFYDEQGHLRGLLRDTPWCDGAVWSMNSMPGVPGEINDFSTKWGPDFIKRLYGPGARGDLDGEYIDSSEGYVTAILNFRRDHFAGTTTPLTFSTASNKPAIFKGFVAYEYIRAIAKDIHGMGKLMMANGTPGNYSLFAPWIDVMGTETNWNPGNTWRPMSHSRLLYRRSMSRGKPYCFLMNTNFDQFRYELVEKYMKRSLAYGMFPGFFSPEASGRSHYFKSRDLYDRDRPLFKKYVPLCKLVAEAGWEPVTMALSGDPQVLVERFGEKYLTVFNDAAQRKQVTITLLGPAPGSSRELVTGTEIRWTEVEGGVRARTVINLEPEDVAVIRMTKKARKLRSRRPAAPSAAETEKKSREKLEKLSKQATEAFRSWIQEAAAAGRRETVYVTIMGKAVRTRIAEANETGITVSYLNRPCSLRWADISNRQLFRMARKYASKPGEAPAPERAELIEAFARVHGFETQ